MRFSELIYGVLQMKGCLGSADIEGNRARMGTLGCAEGCVVEVEGVRVEERGQGWDGFVEVEVRLLGCMYVYTSIRLSYRDLDIIFKGIGSDENMFNTTQKLIYSI